MANIRTGRRSGFILRGGRMRRETLWGQTASVLQTLAVAQTAILTNSLNAAGLALRPFTVIRVRGRVIVRSDQTAGSEDQSVAVGFAVVSDQASAIGVTAVPTPITDGGSDLWLMYQMVKSSLIVGSDSAIAQVSDVDVDSRAMRKVEEGQDLIAVVESDTSGVTAGLLVGTGYRFLIKLH